MGPPALAKPRSCVKIIYMVNKRLLLLLLCCAFPLNLLAAPAPQTAPLSLTDIARSFTGVPVVPDLAEPPAIGAPSQVFSRGDFSQVPDYAFAYLNDVTGKIIDASSQSVDIAMFSMNLKDDPDALLRAVARGVKVRVIIDEHHVFPRADDQVKRLIDAGNIEVRTLRGTRAYGVNHNKICVYDGAIATLGSYNWTFGATFSNYENMLVARNPIYVKAYADYFEWMWSKARPVAQGPCPAELPEGYYGVPPQDPSPEQSLNGVPVPAYLFSPGSGTENRLAAIIDAARISVDAVTFTFSSKPLGDAIIRAKQRGVKVRFMMDEAMAKTSAIAKYVFDGGVDFRVRRGRTDKGAMHNKFAILDGKILETGSFNWTTNASVNSFENVAFVSDQGAIKAYQAKYDWFYSSSTAPTADFFQPEPAITDDGTKAAD